jgi:hypothetical protein
MASRDTIIRHEAREAMKQITGLAMDCLSDQKGWLDDPKYVAKGVAIIEKAIRRISGD